MTVPVARTSVRRNVRMAMVLVAGQAVLCVVIGWVAFGGLAPHRGSTTQAVAPPAIPTGEAPRPGTGPATTPAPGATPALPGWPDPHAVSTDPGLLPIVTLAPPPPAAPGGEPANELLAPPGEGTSVDGAPLASPPITTAPTSDNPLLATPPTTGGNDQGTPVPQDARIQQNVVLGAPCDKKNAAGVTSDGVDAICLADPQSGDLVWQRKQTHGQDG